METVNLIQKLRKIDRKYAFNIFRVRIGGLYMALFFLFSMLLGVALQITNGFANPFITSFKEIEEYEAEVLSKR